MTPSTYIEAHNRHQVRVLAKALRKGKPYHHTVIIVRADSGINELREIKGRTFAFGDIHSTSSHLVPRAMLKQAGVDLTSLRYYEYLGHHDDVAQAVLKGDFDAGGVMEAVALRYESKGIKLLKYSPEVPEFNMATARDLSADEREALRQAVLRLNAANVQDHRVLASINEDYTGFTDAADADFDPIRQIILDLGA
jgi:phosphonate transport system substrate-binding protein